MDSSFWQGKQVFLTGHTGFKGGWLAFWLARMGASLTGYALPPEHEKGFYRATRLERHLDSVYGNILDQALLQQALKNSAPEIVIHMAAQPLVRASYQDPIGTFSTNVMGTAHVLEAVRQAPSVKAVLVITTDKCYENLNQPQGYVESDRLGGYDPYSSSKACTELVAASYRDAFFSSSGIGVATARAGNVIGGGDWAPDRLVPDLMRGIFKKQTVAIRFPQAIRPWQHVLEPLSGYLQLAQGLYEKPERYAGAWNFGPFVEDARPVSWIVSRIDACWPKQLHWQSDEREHPHETNILTLNADKAIRELQWQPRLSLADALEMTVEWYRGLYEDGDAEMLSADQLASYLARPPLIFHQPQPECVQPL